MPEPARFLLVDDDATFSRILARGLGRQGFECRCCSSAEEILLAFSGQRPTVELAPQPPSLERLEWEHLQRVLSENQGNISATARALGMHRRTLQRKLQKRPVRR